MFKAMMLIGFILMIGGAGTSDLYGYIPVTTYIGFLSFVIGSLLQYRKEKIYRIKHNGKHMKSHLFQ